MNAIKVNSSSIAEVHFDSKPFVILNDSGALGDEKLLQSIIAQANQGPVDMKKSFPSLPTPVKDHDSVKLCHHP
jgi:hypothetical protein